MEKEFDMKKFLMALAVTSMAVSPMVTAQVAAAVHKTDQRSNYKTVKKTVTNKRGNRVATRTVTVQNRAPDRYNQTRYAENRNHRNWAKGQRFDRRYATNYRVIDNPRAYRLSNAPRGYQWVRSGNDAVLIAITSGIIGAVIGNAIYR
ncbi:MAG: Ni/Co efflux regulator RcnB [Parasphingorhabdus sp.]|jgi:Ni/Co efflux regulator RcnB|tara:strand:- start:3963 stop:4406 length:444 start_codon:yes stop_codon:yes gene_type:complete